VAHPSNVFGCLQPLSERKSDDFSHVLGPHKVLSLLGSRAVRRRRESRLALGLALGAALLLGVFLPGAEGAGPKKGAQSSLRQQTGLARSHTALLSLYALDSRLLKARSELAGLRGRADSLRRERDRVQQEVDVVAGNLQASQRLLGDRLRALYEEGEPDAIAVLLGARSLDDAVTRLDELERSARQGAQAATDARDGRSKLQGLALELAGRIRQVQALEARAEQTAAALRSARAKRVSYLAALSRRRHLNARQVRALDHRARQVVAKAETVQSQTAPASSVGAPWVIVGARTLTVASTGYSLPGRTSTGLPVGFGIVAVDPGVIPLGTRISIPGYGEGVAADTGSAVQGMTIDLWFPTLAQALAWGRRTVTVTLH
jgi:3D (Asp-Asp-Asp) domain-containing protein/peptidoglycan hydrolase CwlO-like protein